eukprot:276132_1
MSTAATICILIIFKAIRVCGYSGEYVFWSTPGQYWHVLDHCREKHDGLATIRTLNDWNNAVMVAESSGFEFRDLFIGLRNTHSTFIWEDGSQCIFNTSTGGHDCSDFWGSGEPSLTWAGYDQNCACIRGHDSGSPRLAAMICGGYNNPDNWMYPALCNKIVTSDPTNSPTDSPTNYPTDSPTTSQPTLNPTHHPTAYPTSNPTYPIYEPYTVNHYLCTNLVDNVGVFHGETFNQCIDECANCKMVNYFNYFKTNNDSRCYIFDKICNIQPDLHTNKSVIVFDAFFKECVDYPYDWIDNTADSCDHYVSYNWCNNGNILRQADDFNALVDIKYGLTAIQSCCKCGGGVKLFDDVEVSFDNDWTNVDILCSAFIHNDFTSQLNTQHESIRNWDNLILYELCQNLIDVDCEY